MKISRRTFLVISAMTSATVVLDWKKISAFGAKMGPREEYPSVVIGAGLGGLCCGAYLARLGVPVTVVEQHDKPGGYATAFDRKGGKFRFEVSLHGTTINDNTPERILKNLGILEKLDLVELPEVYRLKTPDIDISIPQKDPEAYIRRLGKFFPEEASGIGSFIREMVDLSEETERYSRQSPFKKKYLKFLFPIRFRKMWHVRNKTLSELMDEHVKDLGARSVLSSLWGYYGLPPSRVSGFYYAMATGMYLRKGSCYIRDRSQALSDALAGVIEKAGGEIIYGTAVEKILTREGRVHGVALSDGRQLAARAVAANANAPHVFNRMLDQSAVPAEYLEKINGYRPSISTFIVWLGLNRPLRGKIDGFGIHLQTGRGPEADHASCINGEVEKGPYSVTIFDNAFDGYSRPGTSSLMLLFLCGYRPWEKFEADYRQGEKAAYRLQKEQWTQTLIGRAQRDLIPGLSDMIEVVESATPLTNWRYTGNEQGAIYGFEQSMENAFMNRISNRTPIAGLYLASAWGNPGGGFSGVLQAGEGAFMSIMEDWGGPEV